METLEKVKRYQTEIDELHPFQGDMLIQIRDYYRIGLTWTSNALEGNSLTESETKVLLEDGLTVGGKPLREVYEAVSHANAYDYMFSLMNSRRIDERAALRMHELFYHEIVPEDAGKYRGSRYLPAVIPPILREENITLLERAHRDDHDFVEFIAQRELESQKEMLRLFEIPFPQIAEEPGMKLQ